MDKPGVRRDHNAYGPPNGAASDGPSTPLESAGGVGLRNALNGWLGRFARSHEWEAVMLVSDILKTKGSEVISTTPQATVAEAVRQLADKRIGSVLVMNGDTIAGILSERDIVHALSLIHI